MKLIVIDNYDSFVFNIVQYLGELGEKPIVYRNDEVAVSDLVNDKPDAIVISPGPGTPSGAGVSNEIVRVLGPDVPILGVCLGHQCIGEVFGARIGQADQILHGKTSKISHDSTGVFANLPNPLTATRYHSLVIENNQVPDELIVNARSEDDTIMGIRHREYPLHGVQFHPESILTEWGHELLQNFLKLAHH